MKKYYKCKKLETTLHFLPKEVKFCCSNTKGLGFDIKDTDFSNLKSRIIKAKNTYINQLEKGILPQECVGCADYIELSGNKKGFFNLKSLFEKKIFKISYIIVSHFKECDCSCIYCSQKYLQDSNYKKYEILPVIKKLYKEGLIDEENLKVEFQGGNVTMLKEFDAIIDELTQHNCNKIVINMNGINYLEKLETINFDPSSLVNISLDAGTRETFKKIKNVDAFEQTVNNIRRLKNNTNIYIVLKYVIIHGVNDNIEELNKFLDIAKDLKVNDIIIDIDFRDTMMNHETEFIVPQHYYDMFKTANEYCQKNNMIYRVLNYTQNILDKGRN